jgi:hypothetical protein
MSGIFNKYGIVAGRGKYLVGHTTVIVDSANLFFKVTAAGNYFKVFANHANFNINNTGKSASDLL